MIVSGRVRLGVGSASGLLSGDESPPGHKAPGRD